MPDQRDEMLQHWQQQVALGNEEAFNALFRHFYLNLVNFAVDIIKVRPAAEEIVSDVFVKLWQKRQEIGQIEKLRVFLFVAVKNQCYNYRRDNSMWNVTVSTDNVASLSCNYDPESELAYRELQFLLHKAVEQLPDQCKQVFKMVKEDGLKFKEVAEILQISPRTVETQLYRALKKIRKVIEEQSGQRQTSSDLPKTLLGVAVSAWIFCS
ncbi:RNA polymerase sigma-70 factor [Flavihumibacter solisilvae]|uniref:RNA polymerase sigma-70 factor n=1 Tax=Flavihumibacter solisilvae TaxID=1349421 RepID=UPI001269B559|nr:RNA polymerase sigma-70 factor [Flavihumibacter solisilvae]